ncbi:hypothetical protein [Mongoliitalea daihaiensis]|uniref:hypothetical protein n=1 Tax=Mongoliitalea daihaiensis TaxID=2782006 RepID=UPI001F384CF4|nr:hypothetical protein [Mongoliitalea daihaiensis]UJP65044.1 hypothetical protein IPZ59_20090 [Mongoliitalea daihaiensis]
MFRFRAFRAIDEPAACIEFAEGHLHVLRQYGVTKVTSAKDDWMYNPYVYVVVVELQETGEIVSGLRLHIAHHDYPLPMETAISQVDEQVFDLVRSYAFTGTAEVAGLWNSKSISGYSIGAVYLIRTGIAIATQLGLHSLLALVSEYTLPPSLQKGFEIETTIGNQGAFFYPKLDLVATAIVLKDPSLLSKAEKTERDFIFRLRESLHCITLEKTPKGDVEIEFDLRIANPHWK